MQSILIDTDIAIDFLRGSTKAKTLIVALWQHNTAYLSMLSLYELYAGMHSSETITTENFIAACHIEPLTQDITRLASQHYQDYRKKGVTLTTVDCLIWATAKMNHHKIATRNLRHYPDKNILFDY